jgi:hypothetical protein
MDKSIKVTPKVHRWLSDYKEKDHNIQTFGQIIQELITAFESEGSAIVEIKTQCRKCRAINKIDLPKTRPIFLGKAEFERVLLKTFVKALNKIELENGDSKMFQKIANSVLIDFGSKHQILWKGQEKGYLIN